MAAISLLTPILCGAAVITGYTVISRGGVDHSGKELWAIRSFLSDGVPHLLAVDPNTLKSFDIPAASLRFSDALPRLASTPYGKNLECCTSSPFPLQNDGATHAEHGGGEYLTVDLCPSHRPFERAMFDAVEEQGKGKPVPVAVCITGAWLKSHPEELAFLQDASRRGLLDITWVNHSLTHRYDPKLPLDHNFLLMAGTDLDREVLSVEQLLLAEGLVPSPFFRFPGLVANEAAVQRLRELSLIPIGSDAWLAKGEHPKEGSFILVHGNGNEPKGIKLLMPLLSSLSLKPLPEAFLP